LLKGGVGAIAAAAFGGVSLAACGGGGDDDPAAPPAPADAVLGFPAVAKDLADQVVVPAGYTATVIYATGDSIDPAVGDYRNDGSDDTFSRRAGDHHDAMVWFGLAADGVSRDAAATDRALLCMNHENIAGTVLYLHPAGQTNISAGVR